MLGRQEKGIFRQQLFENDASAAAGMAGYLALIHQAARTEYAQSHACGRLEFAGQDERQILDAGAFVVDADDQNLWLGFAFNGEYDRAVRRIVINIARQFGHGCGDARLVLRAEPAQRSDLSCALARRNDINLGMNSHTDDSKRHVHYSVCWRTTSTVESSRRRLKSRYRTAAISAGWQLTKPG